MNAAGTTSVQSRVDVVGTGAVPECMEERAVEGVDWAAGSWATTPAGREALIECSELLDYSGGLARRQCISRGNGAEWDMPDFSECVHEDFAAIRDNVSSRAGNRSVGLQPCIPPLVCHRAVLL